jgi:hypothetical protein
MPELQFTLTMNFFRTLAYLNFLYSYQAQLLMQLVEHCLARIPRHFSSV